MIMGDMLVVVMDDKNIMLIRYPKERVCILGDSFFEICSLEIRKNIAINKEFVYNIVHLSI